MNYLQLYKHQKDSAMFLVKLLSGFFSATAGRIFAGCDPFTIAVGAVFNNSAQINRHKSYYFIFTGLVPAVTFDSVLHICLLDIHIQRLRYKKG